MPRGHNISHTKSDASPKAIEAASLENEHSTIQAKPTLKVYGGIGSGDNSLPKDYAPSPVDKIGAFNSAMAAIDAARPVRTETTKAEPAPALTTNDTRRL